MQTRSQTNMQTRSQTNMQTRNQTNMQIRSQTNMQPISKKSNYLPLYDDINFDEASKAWRENKKSIGNGMYKYICCLPKINGNKCGKTCLVGEIYCRSHYKKYARLDLS